MYNFFQQLDIQSENISSAYLTTLHIELYLKRNNLQFTDIRSTTPTMFSHEFFISEREAEEVDEALNETLKQSRRRGSRPILF